ncbi:hypothetical protein TNCV_972041 [Trichonephila clavipes]|nr:hypothetical protein TNCV_972041 [Trichonephila clavipes]
MLPVILHPHPTTVRCFIRFISSATYVTLLRNRRGERELSETSSHLVRENTSHWLEKFYLEISRRASRPSPLDTTEPITEGKESLEPVASIHIARW